MNVPRILFFLALVCLNFSCQKIDETSEFEANLFVSLFSTYEVTILRPEYLSSSEALKSPPATWQTLIRFKLPSENGNKEMTYCLNYQMPYEKIKMLGELRLEELNSQGGCLGTGDVGDKSVKSSLDQINHLFIYLSAEKQVLKTPQKELQPFVLYLKFERKGNETWIKIPLVNLEKGRILLEGKKYRGQVLSKERYASPLIARFIFGVQVLPLGKAERILSPSQALGERADNYAEEKIVSCHDLKPDCTELKPFHCNECRYGWYEVSGSRCKGGYIKFCGIRRCGQKDEPACLRGTEFSKLSNLCFEGSNAGFCQEGLHTYCDSNKILICK